jgi:uncharacterized alpha/beta hydrolase family protein
MRENKVLILVHGFIKNSKDMSSLAKIFKDDFEEIIAVDLPTIFVDIEVAVSKLSEILKNIPNTKQLTFIAHSMGGLITCKAIGQLNLKNVEKCVFIATPFRGSNVANFGHKIPFYSKILKPNKNLLVTDNYLDYCNNAMKNIPVGLVAGNKHSKLNLLSRVLLISEHDGLVEVSSALAINNCDKIVVNMNHQKIHHDITTLQYVKNFLKNGSFSSFA